MIPIALAIVASTAAGILAERRWEGRAGVASRRLLLLSLYTALPFVTFFNLATVELDADLGGGVAVGWVALALAAGAAWAIGRFALRGSRPVVGAIVVCTLIANTGYLGYPLVAILLGFDRIGEAVIYDVGVGAPALLLAGFATAAAFGTKAGEGLRERTVAFLTRNPPLYAAIAALIAPEALAPEPLVDASRVLIVLLLPLGFFAVGAALEEEAEEGRVRFPPPLAPPVAAVISTRLVLAPGLLYLLALPVIDLPGPYLLLAAMPTGLNSMIVAHAYGLDLRTTAGAVAWTTALAVLVALVTVLV